MKIFKLPIATVFIFCSFTASMWACKKTPIEPVEVYPDAPTPLVKFLDGQPVPNIGNVGSIITYSVTGLKGKEGQFKFFINQTEAEIISVTENQIKVRVPENASSGGASVLINGEYYFGPTLTVRGLVSIDPQFNIASNQANHEINGIFLRQDNNSYLVYGRFTNYANLSTATNVVTGMAVLDLNGNFGTTQLTTGAFGFNGAVSSMNQLPDGRYLTGGSFSRYDKETDLNNIVTLNANGTLQTMTVDVINPDPVNNPGAGLDTVAAFNGGTGGQAEKLFFQPADGSVIAVGNFNSYISTFYERSTKGGPLYDIVKARQIIRMKSTGSFDSTYNFNKATNESYAGGNGNILDAIQINVNQIYLVGNFTTFSGKTVNGITRINPENGLPDETFNVGGSGVDGTINKIRYNATTGKIMLTGNFNNYNGSAARGVVLINPDGSIDNSFEFKGVEGGIVNFAGQLNNGKIIISGSFNKYNGFIRPGFAILNPDGTLAANYNNIGLFRGRINDFAEGKSSTGGQALFLVGAFDRFDNKVVGNIVKIRFDN